MPRTRRRCIVAALFITGIALMAVVHTWTSVQGVRAELRCKETLSRQLSEIIRQPNDRNAPHAAVAGSAEIDRLTCAASGHPYVYRVPDEEITWGGQSVGGRKLYRMIAWCPSARHGGCRVVLLEHGAVHMLSEPAFQRAVEAGYLCENRSDTGD